MKYIIILIILYIIFSPKKKNYSRKRKRRSVRKVRTVLRTEIADYPVPVKYSPTEYRRYMAKNLPELLHTYNVFYPCYFTRLAEGILTTGTFEKYTDDEILPNVTPSDESKIYNFKSR